MPSTDSPRLRRHLAVLGIAAALAAAAGARVPSTFNAQAGVDEPQYLLTAISIGEDGDLDISDELAQQRWRVFHAGALPEQTRPLTDGRRVSPHDPLLPMLLALPMLAGGWLAAKLTLAALAGLLAAATAWVAIRRFDVAERVALPVVAVFSLSAPLAVYGNQVYPEVPAALAAVLGVAAVTGSLRRRGIWVLAAAVIALPWLATKYVPVAVALVAVAGVKLWHEGRRKPLLGLAITFTAAWAVFALVHLVVWTGLTSYASGDHFVGGEFTAVGRNPNYAGRSRRLVGLLVDREFGLAAWQPAWLLLVPGVARLVRGRPHGWLALTLPLAVGWLTATFVALTMQGYWFPGRQVVVVLPLGVIAIAVAARELPWLRVAAVAAGLLGIWSYAWLLGAGMAGDINWVVNFFTVADPWYRLWRGALPHYLEVTSGTWIRHGAWLAAAAPAIAARTLGLSKRSRGDS